LFELIKINLDDLEAEALKESKYFLADTSHFNVICAVLGVDKELVTDDVVLATEYEVFRNHRSRDLEFAIRCNNPVEHLRDP
jgi:uncharacterized protein (UPF0216 family)